MSHQIAPTVFYRRLNVEGLEIFYREAGPTDAPTVLLLHSWLRWAVILLGLLATIRAIAGASARRPWAPFDDRISKLRDNGRTFLAAAKERGLDTGLSIGASVVPIIVGSSPATVILSQRLLARGYNVVPIIFPGVAENQARLRFFITASHTEAQIRATIGHIVEALAGIRDAVRSSVFSGSAAR